LELLTDKTALTVSEVGVHLSLQRSAAHRFLATLRDLGYVEKNEDNRYQLTFRILEMGEKILDRFDIRNEARKFMLELSNISNETINLGIWNGSDILHLDKVESTEILKIDSSIWSTAPAYCTSLGKAILANLTKEELNDYLKRTRLVSHSPNTIVSRKKLREELKKTFERGFAVDNEEYVLGLRCIAAPVFNHTGRVKYAMSVTYPAMRKPQGGVENIGSKIKDICRRLSVRLGYQPGG
jgi:DNA-binding IclR family transcriptional regulator